MNAKSLLCVRGKLLKSAATLDDCSGFTFSQEEAPEVAYSADHLSAVIRPVAVTMVLAR